MSFLNDDPVEHTNVGRIAYYTDEVHNYEFRVEHKNGSTVISPREPGERVELKIGILLPFHQTSDNVTRELTIRYISREKEICSRQGDTKMAHTVILVVHQLFAWQQQKSTHSNEYQVPM